MPDRRDDGTPSGAAVGWTRPALASFRHRRRPTASDFGWRWALDGQRVASREAFPKAALGRFTT